MKPIIKYPGGKERELKYVIERLPDYNTYIEPFCGGAAVYFGLDSKISFINDKSEDLINMYQCIKGGDVLFLKILKHYNKTWKFISEFIDNNEDCILNYYKDNDVSFIENAFGRKLGFYMEESLLEKLQRCKKIEEVKGTLPDGDRIGNVECGLKQGFYYYVRDIYI